MIKLSNILKENYSHIRYLVSDLKNLYYEVDDEKLKKIILDLIPSGTQYTYTPQKSDFYIKKFNELEILSKKVLKSNNPALKSIQKIVKGGMDFWNQKENIKEVEVAAGHENDRDMVVGVAEILRMVDDMNNRKEIADAMLRKFKSEEVIHNADEFLTLCGISS
jgi:hypothetical protein